MSSCPAGVASKHIYSLFRQNNARPFLFVKPAGNFGDELLFKGAEKLARLAQVQFESLEFEQFMDRPLIKDEVVYIHGGGNFNSIWHKHPILALERLVREHKGLTILGPQSFFIDEQFLKENLVDKIKNYRPQDLFIFCRDQTSYSALKNIAPASLNVGIDHDTALNLSIEDMGAADGLGNFTLYAIREDIERSNIKRDRLDGVWIDPITYAQSFDQWVSLHKQARQIFTNRLHSAILGSILKKKVTLLANSYHKNNSVWEFSLKSRGVVWQEHLDSGKIRQFIAAQWFFQKFVNSYKINSFLIRRYKI